MNLKTIFKGIKGKLTVMILVTIISNIVINVVYLDGLSIIHQNVELITNVRMPSIKGLEAMNEGQTAVMQVIGVIERSEGQKEDLEKLYKRYQEKRNQITTGFKLYEPLPQTPDEAEEYTGVFLKKWKEWEDACDAYVIAEKGNRHEEASKHYQEIYKTFATSEASLGKIIAINYKNATDDKNNIESKYQKVKYVGLLVFVISLLLALSFGIYFTRIIMISLRGVSSQLQDSSNVLSVSSKQVASLSEELSQANTEQSASLQETSSSIEEISSMISANNENAKQSSITSEQSLDKAEKGKAVIQHMIKAIGDIDTSNNEIMNQVNETNKEIENITKIIDEIGTKTKVINDIVFQTKLLSFNASVEAARAGEQGKGFAVVAEEVGNLAAMSGAAALEITKILDDSVKTVESIINKSKASMNVLILNGKDKVEIGTQVANECEEVLIDIVSSVASVSRMVTEISTASQEQSQGVHEITKAIGQLNIVTQQNSINSNESVSSANSLAEQAKLLSSLVQELEQVVEGGRGRS